MLTEDDVDQRAEDLAKSICRNKLEEAKILIHAREVSKTQGWLMGEKKRIIGKLETASRVSSKDLKATRGFASSSMATFGFLAVLSGVELDFVGFVMACPQYWSFNGEYHEVVKVFLIFMPTAYIYAAWRFWQDSQTSSESVENLQEVLLRAKAAQEQQQAQRGSRHRSSRQITPPAPPRADVLDQASQFANHASTHPTAGFGMDDSMREVEAVRKAKADKMSVRDHPRVRWFHLFPLARLFLVVSNLKADDIEVVFRLNSLSSFSLGVCQLLAVCFTVIVAGETPNIVVYINLASQAINWLITIMYFTTSAADAMKASLVVSAVACRCREQQQADLVDYFRAVQTVAEDLAKSQNRSGAHPVPAPGTPLNFVQQHKLNVAHELDMLTQHNVEFRWFTFLELLLFRSKIYKRLVNRLGVL
jgi:hypothetical protein